MRWRLIRSDTVHPPYNLVTGGLVENSPRQRAKMRTGFCRGIFFCWRMRLRSTYTPFGFLDARFTLTLKSCQLVKRHVLCLFLLKEFKRKLLPAIVFRNIRYSKLEISLLCHFCVMFEFRMSCLGDIILARLKVNKTRTIFSHNYLL